MMDNDALTKKYFGKEEKYFGITSNYPEEIIVSDNHLSGRNRAIGSLFVQDDFSLTGNLNLTMGLRYDHYNDLENMVTPRLAMVYRLKDHHIFKAQYAEGFKSSTYIVDIFKPEDEYINDEEHERIRTIELGYIYKGIDTDARITLFHSKINDLVSPFYDKTKTDFSEGFNRAFVNISIEEAETWGFELEFEKRLNRSFRVNGNLSYVKTKYLGDENYQNSRLIYVEKKKGPDGEDMFGAADWLANFDIIYRLVEDVALAVHYRYVGKRHRIYKDSERESLNAYQTVDLTLNIYNLFHEGLTLRMGLKNVFDDDVAYPSMHKYLYENDFPRAGREWWVQWNYEF